MRQKKTIVSLLTWFLMLATISPASNFQLSKLNLASSPTEHKSISATRSENMPLQEKGSTTSTSRVSLEEDDDDTSNEKILTTTFFIRSESAQPFYFMQNVFETLDLEILTPPPQKK
jgi:hypothetical protein